MAEKMNNLTGKEWLQHSFSIWKDIRKTSEERSLKHPAMFPTMLVERLISIYTKNEDEIILDPFLGSGTTLLACQNTNRNGIGCEISKEYTSIAEERLENSKLTLFNEISEKNFQKILTGDSRETLGSIEDNSVSLSISSPPYWDILNQKRTVDKKAIRNYSDKSDDIGNISDYKEFIDNLKDIYKEVYRTLKPNKRCVINVMDIRKKDKFYPLHIDISIAMREIGFELEEFIIWDRQHEYNNMRTLGYPWVFRVNKVHEFLCVFWKR